jgi:hypothetical protein
MIYLTHWTFENATVYPYEDKYRKKEKKLSYYKREEIRSDRTQQ